MYYCLDYSYLSWDLLPSTQVYQECCLIARYIVAHLCPVLEQGFLYGDPTVAAPRFKTRTASIFLPRELTMERLLNPSRKSVQDLNQQSLHFVCRGYESSESLPDAFFYLLMVMSVMLAAPFIYMACCCIYTAHNSVVMLIVIQTVVRTFLVETSILCPWHQWKCHWRNFAKSTKAFYRTWCCAVSSCDTIKWVFGYDFKAYICWQIMSSPNSCCM